MKIEIKHRYEAFQRVVRYLIEHPLTPVNARATALLATLQTVITAMQLALSNQILGRGETLGGAADRRRIAKELRGSVREIAGTAAVLDPDQYPGAAEQFRLPASRSYEALLGAARGFLTAIGTIKAAFVERGMPADFDEKLAEKAFAMEDATSRKWDGKQSQKGGTAGLVVQSRLGMAAVMELDRIVSNKLRLTDPALLEVWKAAKRQDRMPVREQAEQPLTTLAVASANNQPLANREASGGNNNNGHEAENAGVEPRVNGSAAALVA